MYTVLPEVVNFCYLNSASRVLDLSIDWFVHLHIKRDI